MFLKSPMFLKTLSIVPTEPARPAALPSENSEKALTFIFFAAFGIIGSPSYFPCFLRSAQRFFVTADDDAIPSDASIAR